MKFQIGMLLFNRIQAFKCAGPASQDVALFGGKRLRYKKNQTKIEGGDAWLGEIA